MPLDAGGLAKRMLEIGRDCAARLPAQVLSVDHGELLYDENGLLFKGEDFGHTDVTSALVE